MANVNYRNASPNRTPTLTVNYDNMNSVNIPMEPIPVHGDNIITVNPSSNPSSPLIRRTRNRRSVSPNNSGFPTSQPLLEPDVQPGNNQPPLAGPEIDDLDEHDIDVNTNSYPGVDDGLVLTSRSGPGNVPSENRPNVPDTESFPSNIPTEFPINTPAEFPNTNDNRPREEPRNVPRIPNENPSNVPPRIPDNVPGKPYPSDRNYPVSPGPFPYAPEFGPTDNRGPGIASGVPRQDIPDVNLYQHKKTLAQGMMDLALFSANANQLRYVLETFNRHPYYYPSIVLITLSLLLQVAVGVGLIWNTRYDVKNEVDICIANKVNNYTVIGIFIVTVINVFISAFGVAN